MNFVCESTQGQDGALNLCMSGSLRVSDANEISHVMHESFLSSCGDILLDLSEIEHIDAAGVQILLALGRALKDGGRRLVLNGISSSVARYLELAGVADELGVHPSTRTDQEKL